MNSRSTPLDSAATWSAAWRSQSGPGRRPSRPSPGAVAAGIAGRPPALEQCCAFLEHAGGGQLHRAGRAVDRRAVGLACRLHHDRVQPGQLVDQAHHGAGRRCSARSAGTASRGTPRAAPAPRRRRRRSRWRARRRSAAPAPPRSVCDVGAQPRRQRPAGGRGRRARSGSRVGRRPQQDDGEQRATADASAQPASRDGIADAGAVSETGRMNASSSEVVAPASTELTTPANRTPKPTTRHRRGGQPRRCARPACRGRRTPHRPARAPACACTRSRIGPREVDEQQQRERAERRERREVRVVEHLVPIANRAGITSAVRAARRSAARSGSRSRSHCSGLMSRRPRPAGSGGPGSRGGRVTSPARRRGPAPGPRGRRARRSSASTLTSTASTPLVWVAQTVAGPCAAARATTRYAVVSTASANRRGGTAVTRSGAVSPSAPSAAPSPSSRSTTGNSPRASARRSSIAARSSVSASASCGDPDPSRDRSSRSASDRPTRRCWAPSCRSRSSRRRSSSPVTDDARTGRPQVGQLGQRLGLQPLVLQAEVRGRAELVDQVRVGQQPRPVHQHREVGPRRPDRRRLPARPGREPDRTGGRIDVPPSPTR